MAKPLSNTSKAIPEQAEVHKTCPSLFLLLQPTVMNGVIMSDSIKVYLEVGGPDRRGVKKPRKLPVCESAATGTVSVVVEQSLRHLFFFDKQVV